MIAIIGAGISGLTSALTLQKLGHNVVLIDKGRSVGGRLATRYFEHNSVKRYIDTASHYIELSDETPQFKRLLLSFFPHQTKSDQLLGTDGINSVAKTLSHGLGGAEIVLAHKANNLSYDASTRQFSISALNQQEKRTFDVDGVVLTAPVPQSIELLSQFPALTESLRTAPDYHRCLLLLLWPKARMTLKQFTHPDLVDRIVFQKHIESNIEPIPIAVHASYAWSDAHYHESDQEIEATLIEATGITKNDFYRIQVKRWGQAQPILDGSKRTESKKGYEMDQRACLVVCSDALGLGNIHHAGESGINAALALSERLNALRSRM